MSARKMWLPAVIALTLVGCDDDGTNGPRSGDGECAGGQCGFSFSGSGFDAYEGKTLYWGLQVQGSMGLVYQDQGVIQAGRFDFDAPDALDQGRSYNLNYFVDVNDNVDCEASVDPVWRLQFANVQQGTSFEVEPDASQMNNLGCSGHP